MSVGAVVDGREGRWRKMGLRFILNNCAYERRTGRAEASKFDCFCLFGRELLFLIVFWGLFLRPWSLLNVIRAS